jgi:hypothetical protein
MMSVSSSIPIQDFGSIVQDFGSKLLYSVETEFWPLKIKPTKQVTYGLRRLLVHNFGRAGIKIAFPDFSFISAFKKSEEKYQLQ